jgi:organic hydroperoxide reductase OsmC/OhrA
MGGRQHHYRVGLDWSGGSEGTAHYTIYSRDHRLTAANKPEIEASSDPAFPGGDPSRWNPEELQVAALSSCHMLWYLALCAAAGVRVLTYRDDAEGWMADEGMAGGQFTRVVLKPRVGIAPDCDLETALALHRDAHAKCYIARSVNFPVEHDPDVRYSI